MTENTPHADLPEATDFPWSTHNSYLFNAAVKGDREVVRDLWAAMVDRWPERDDLAAISLAWFDTYASIAGFPRGTNVSASVGMVVDPACGHDHAQDSVPADVQFMADLMKARLQMDKSEYDRLLAEAEAAGELESALFTAVLLIGHNIVEPEDGTATTRIDHAGATLVDEVQDHVNQMMADELAEQLHEAMDRELHRRVPLTGIMQPAEPVDPGECVDGNCTACAPNPIPYVPGGERALHHAEEDRDQGPTYPLCEQDGCAVPFMAHNDTAVGHPYIGQDADGRRINRSDPHMGTGND